MTRDITIINPPKPKRSPRSGSKKVPQDCKPRTKCGNTGMMPPNMYELRGKACANRTCPLCIL